MQYLRPDNAFLFRITHVDNVAWMLAHDGLHCQSADLKDSNFVSIGNSDLIDKRTTRDIPTPPGGTLSDYVPFYFTPHSIMAYNIKTGYGEVKQRNNRDLVFLISSLYQLRELGRPFLFTNQHAYLVDTEFYDDLDQLGRVDWALLRNRNFQKSDDDPGRPQRYQAEALVHRHVPLEALLGIRCYNDDVREQIQALAQTNSLEIDIKAAPALYF